MIIDNKMKFNPTENIATTDLYNTTKHILQLTELTSKHCQTTENTSTKAQNKELNYIIKTHKKTLQLTHHYHTYLAVMCMRPS